MSRNTRKYSREDDDRYYLRDGFDPNSLTITQLRSIFVEHEIDPPSTSTKKAGWVEHFKEHVLTKADQLLNQYDNIQPHGKGIVDAVPPKRVERTTRARSPLKSDSSTTTTRTRTMSPAKEVSLPTNLEFKAEIIPPPAPSSPRRSKKSSTTTAKNTLDTPIPLIIPEQFKQIPPIYNQQQEQQPSLSTTTSPKKKLGRKTLPKVQFISPDDHEVSSSSAPLKQVSIAGTSPRKSVSIDLNKEREKAEKAETERIQNVAREKAEKSEIDRIKRENALKVQEAEKLEKSRKKEAAKAKAQTEETPKESSSPFSAKNVFQAQSPDSSPFSKKNVFQKGSPTSPKASSSRKRSNKEVEVDSKTSVKSPKRRAKETQPVKTDGDILMTDALPQQIPIISEQQRSQPSFQSINTPSRQATSIHVTPGSAVRHFTQFPTTPDEEIVVPVVPATAPNPNIVRDHSFPRQSDVGSVYASNKRLSFMPGLGDLRVSNEFSRQLQETQPRIVFEQNLQPAFQLESEDEQELENGLEQQQQDKEEQKADTDLRETELVKELETEIENEQKVKSKHSKVRLIRKHIKSSFSFGSIFSSFLRISVIISLACFSVWWLQERLRIGYCDVDLAPTDRSHGNGYHKILGQSSSVGQETGLKAVQAIVGQVLDRVVDYVEPGCVPCPAHASCYPNFKAECDEDFVYVESPFSFGGNLPFAPSCVPDTEKQRRIVILAQKVIQILRQRNADVECGKSPEKSAAIAEDDLKAMLLKMKASTLSEDEFNDLWRHALKDIENEEDIIVRQE